MSIIYSISFVISLGVFLIILKQFATSCTNLVDHKKKETLLKSKNIITMVISGAILSAITQSSSVVVIMVIGLVEGRVITEKNGLAAVLGTEVGTTITGQLLSLPKGIVYYFVPALLIITVIIPKLKPIRRTVFWFGLLIGSLYLMGIPVKGLTTSNESALIRNLLLSANSSIGIAISIGFGFTALIQSSSALTALAINLGRAGVLKLSGALGLVIGANLGTCITGLIASFAFSKSVKTIVIGQILFNLLGVIILFMMFEPFLIVVTTITSSGLIERQIANGQTIFNLMSLFVVLPVFTIYYKMVKKIANKLM